jgi:hypothetical protein
MCELYFVISSCAPLLSSIIKARENFAPISPRSLKGFIVAEAEAPDLSVLAGVCDESRIVAEGFTSAFVNILTNIDVVHT